jgi:sugar phosphate isomerase/epimerase/S-ribosylhomocysteine lyase LuxS involved in autoinducer biosynthesis
MTMGIIKLSYSTFGLTKLDFMEAIDAVGAAGYAGIEIAFHRDQFNPFDIDDDYLDAVRKRLAKAGVQGACVATASHFFDPLRPHEPSLLDPDLAGRKRRIDLVKRGIHVARRLGIPLVTCGSGFIRAEHIRNPSIDPHDLLVDSIRQCLLEIRPDEDITLLIEPEPGMLIETIDDGLTLVDEIDSPHFRLHVDLCHAYCSEPDYIAALARAAPLTRYLHISDTRQGYNLKIASDSDELGFDLRFASTLVYFPSSADYLLVDATHPLYFSDEPPNPAQRRCIDALLQRAGVDKAVTRVDYASLYAGSSPLDDEIFTYLISVPGLSFDVLERARPVIAYLRGARNPPLIGQMVANTLTGIVHFHEIPGEGTLDFAASFKALTDHGFSGYGAVELYHHIASWQKALDDSYRHLSPFIRTTGTSLAPAPALAKTRQRTGVEELGWDPRLVGELDHRQLKAPSLKLRSARSGRHGDMIYCVDLRVCRPNAGHYLSATELHSLEHFLLEGFQRQLPENFVSVGIMGCQTGFYLIFLNEGRAAILCDALASILGELISAAGVPYQRIEQCGHYEDHNLELAQDVARHLLQARAHWLEAA